MIIFLFITQNYKITYFSNKTYFYHFFFKKKKKKKKKKKNIFNKKKKKNKKKFFYYFFLKKKKIKKKKWQNIFLKEKNIIMNQEESQNTREKYLTDWQAMLIKQEIGLFEKQTSFKMYEADLL